jgi:S1-C subfamily serine protease
MKKIIFYFCIVFSAMSASLFGIVEAFGAMPLSREDIASLTKPSVVRIGQHVTGTVSIPAFTIDLKNQTVSVDATRPSKTVSIDETLSGTGFAVSSDGYIVTNAHVVSLVTTKIDVITNAILPFLYENALGLNDEETKALFQNEDSMFSFTKKVFEYVSDHSTFTVNQKLVVFDPSSKKEKFNELLEEGFPAQIVSVNDHFYDDDKDVALIKIDRESLPTLALGSSEDLNVGRQVSIFGFPATAEFNQRNPIESTFTQGVISALKDSEHKDFKVFQTDAKVSEGSSGGSLLNDTGDVVGIITFQTNQFQKNSGDTFAFAIPVELVKTMIAESGVELHTSAYHEYFTQGLHDVSAKHCLDALQWFERAKESGKGFDVSRYVNPYETRCQALIQSGQSIDTFRSKIENVVEQSTVSMRFAIGIAGMLALSIGFLIWWLIREVNKEEREIRELKQRLHEEEKREYKNHQLLEKLSGKK